jgi:hypothetical protein
MDPLREISQIHPAQPLPDPDYLQGFHTGWGIWIEPDSLAEEQFSDQEEQLGPLLTESQAAFRKPLVTGLILGILSPGLMLISLAAPELTVFFLILGGILLGIAIYKLLRTFLARDLRLRIFREGFSLRLDQHLRVVRWGEVVSLREDWRNTVYQGIVRIHIHRLTIRLSSGEELLLDRRLDKIEQVSRQLQNAVTQAGYPAALEQLEKGKTLEFGPFQLNRWGLAYKGKKALAWDQVSQLNLQRHGDINLQVHEKDAKKLSLGWAIEKGRNIDNLQLFLFLAEWFLTAADRMDRPDVLQAQVNSPITRQIEDGIYTYHLLINNDEADQGTTLTTYIGPRKSEKAEQLTIPPGAETGLEFSFPGQGPPDPETGQPSDLLIKLMVSDTSPRREKFKTIQQTIGIMIIIMAYIWLGFFSTWSFWTRLVSAVLVGGLGGALIGDQRWRLGLLCGVIGGAVSLTLQDAYYLFNYRQFGRTSFWNYESFLVLIFSLAPGIGLYYGLLKWIQKQEEQKASYAD